MLRHVILTDGTGMGDSVIIFETDSPVDELKELERISCEVYINGGDYEDVPNWASVLKEKGYTFEYVDSHQHITPTGTSREWLEDKYPEIMENYVIENQPEIEEG